RCEARIKGVPVIIRIVAIPSSKILTRRRFPDHRAKRFHQCVIIEPHQHRMCLPQLFFMEWAIERDIPIAELFKHTGGSRCRRRRERISGNREKTRSRSYGHRLKKSSARDRRQRNQASLRAFCEIVYAVGPRKLREWKAIMRRGTKRELPA